MVKLRRRPRSKADNSTNLSKAVRNELGRFAKASTIGKKAKNTKNSKHDVGILAIFKPKFVFRILV